MPIEKPWRWVKMPDDVSDGMVTEGERRLLDPRGRNRATVWANGTWHTWDTEGVGGENDCAVRMDGEIARPQDFVIRDAMDCALAAVVRQGWTNLNLVYEKFSAPVLPEKKT